MGVLKQILFVFAIQTFIISPWRSRSPYTMVTAPPSGSKPWADQPMSLITTPQFETHKTDLFTTGATHMCLLHNAIIRGFNSIYLQAPHVSDADKDSFVGYARTWFRFVKSHHDDEEQNLFPKVEEVLDDKNIWVETHAEHGIFFHLLLIIHPDTNAQKRIVPRWSWRV